MTKSHEYASKLKELAEFLLSKPEFEFDSEPYLFQYFYSGNKSNFLAAARALGAAQKEYNETEFRLTVIRGAKLAIAISRSVVCKKVQEEKWECEPLLSQEEEAAIGA